MAATLLLLQSALALRGQPTTPALREHFTTRTCRRHALAWCALGALAPKSAIAALQVGDEVVLDSTYPGTAVARMTAIRQRARSLSSVSYTHLTLPTKA